MIGSPSHHERRQSPLGRGTRVALVVAVGWGVALLIAAAAVPAVSSTSVSGSGPGTQTTVTHSSSTLLEGEGPSVLVPVAAPLVAAGGVACILRRRRTQGRPGVGAVGWTVVAVLGILDLLGAMSIGLFMVPVTIALAVACALTPAAPIERGGAGGGMLAGTKPQGSSGQPG